MHRSLSLVGLLAVAGVALAVPGSQRQAPVPPETRPAKPVAEVSGKLAGLGADIKMMVDDPVLVRQRELERNQPIARRPAAGGPAPGPQRRVIELDPTPPESIVNPTKNFLYQDLTDRDADASASAYGLDAAARAAQVERLRQAALAKRGEPN